LKKSFDIEEDWVSYQLRPETPPDGIPLSVLFPGADLRKRVAHFNQLGAPYGFSFGLNEKISNSGLALEASEFAREKGAFDRFHELVFRAYFGECKDIGKIEVLEEIAVRAGLPPLELKEALSAGRYAEKLAESKRSAESYEITAVPTFIIEGQQRIVGVQKIQVFHDILEALSAGKRA
jgi:predicted DsbA family dithiol-disulfide isomerase